MGNLSLTTIAEGQLDMYQTSNDADNELDLAMTDLQTYDLSAGDATVSVAEMVRAVCFQASGNTVARALNFPAKRRLFIVENQGSHALSVVIGTTSLSVSATDSGVFYADGTTNGLATVVGSTGASGAAGGALAGAYPNPTLATSLVTVAASAGASNNVDPGSGWPGFIDRLDVTLGAGAANWTGLKAGNDGQHVVLSNQDGANTLTLGNANAGSTAANRFAAVDDMPIAPGESILLVYYAGGVNRWRVV